MTDITISMLVHLINFYDELSSSELIQREYAAKYLLTEECLRELLDRRKKDCDHEIISIKNEIIDNSYMCIHCGLILKQADPEKAREKLNA